MICMIFMLKGVGRGGGKGRREDIIDEKYVDLKDRIIPRINIIFSLLLLPFFSPLHLSPDNTH